jgi:hypothetical protein
MCNPNSTRIFHLLKNVVGICKQITVLILCNVREGILQETMTDYTLICLVEINSLRCCMMFLILSLKQAYNEN